MTGLKISPQLSLPLDAITETFALLAVRRAGKSNAAVVMAEEMYDNGLPWVAVDPKGDWWGVRAAGDGKAPGLAVLVFGGLHGDVPLEPTAGRLVADLIVEQRLTCVLDVSEMSKADMRRFLIDFALRLYQRNAEPLHVFCEEADEYIPQRVMGENAALVGAFEKLIKRGGFRGIGVTLITQRSASLNKDVLTQVGTLIPMRTPSPQDRKAISAWVDVHDAGKELVDDLPSLDNGEAYIFSPQWLNTLTKIKFRRRRTFDSGATPKVGQKARPPAALAEVDLASIKEAMAETIEKQQADDPKVLRKRIAELERELAKKPPAAAPEIVEIRIPVVNDDEIATMDSLLRAAEHGAKMMVTAANQFDASRARLKEIFKNRDRAPQTPAADVQAGLDRRAVARAPRPAPAAPVDGEVRLRAGARRILETFARNHPMRLTKAQLGTLAKFKITGGTFGTYWSEINRLGFIDDNGADYTLTQAGFDYIGIEPGNPQTTDEILDAYRSVLRAGARRMLDIIISVYPGDIHREDLADQLEMVASGGTFGTYLSDLRRNGLVDVDRDGQVRANDILFPGSAA